MKTVIRIAVASLIVFPFSVSASDSGPRYSLDRNQKLQTLQTKDGAEAILQIDSSLNSSINPTRTNSSSAADLKAPEQGPEQTLDESRSRAMTKSRL